MAAVIWSPVAATQLEAIVDYIEQFNPVAARRLAERLIAVADGLRDYPDRGCPVGEGGRELVVVRPYVILYQVRAATVEILTIRHAARLPDGA